MAPVTLFLFEEMASSSFRLESKTYNEMEKTGFTIETILQTLRLTKKSNEYNFFLFGGLNRKAVTFIDNSHMLACYDRYNDQSVITIIVRYNSDPSPYDAQAPSAMASLHEKRVQSKIDELQNPVLNPEPFLELLEVHGAFLGYRNLQKEKMNRKAYLEILFDAHPYFEDKVGLFIKDLRESCNGSRANLRSTRFPYSLERHYFSGEEFADILGIPLFPGTLKERLEAIPEEEFIVYPRLVSIFLRAFNWNWSCIELKGKTQESSCKYPEKAF
ncbi:hypothetical protein N7481_004279 [Penicillium waksmanii]|uniref:uncharacterized protein n=1 Tax=Penicillium waksmanii TaxID=69791 RepID=UPI0025489E31|nr:uncharacterized protein N7481_004279 [Penicillium waksmanii]KAJ5989069.1 hypothetical protein N7481_004279 [Penicillium waksmanii]